MSFFEQLKQVPGVKLHLGLDIVARQGEDGVWYFRLNWTPGGKNEDYVRFSLHYLATVLTRYPRSDSYGYRMATELQEFLVMIVNEGVWPGSDLVRYAGLSGRVMVEEKEESGKGERVEAALVTNAGESEPRMMVSEPVRVPDEGLVFSVVAVLQGAVTVLDEAGVELLDRSLRYFLSYLDEGAVCSDLTTAASLANRAWRAAVKG